MSVFNLKHLEAFYWAARLGRFAAAAERLHLTQSSVSMRIAELERRFGTTLFDRSQKKVRLTPKGEELLVYTERLLQLTSEIQERIAKPETLSGTVRIGVAEAIARTWLASFIRLLHQRYPRVTVRIEVALSFELAARLQASTLDVILSPGHPIESGFVTQSLGLLEFEWMAGPLLKLPRRRLTPSDLQDQWIILLPGESYYSVMIDQWFRSHKARPGPAVVCNSMGALAALTMSGLGISLLSPKCHQHDLSTGQLMVLKTTMRCPPIEFFVTRSAKEFEPLNELVADLAIEASTFTRPTVDCEAGAGTLRGRRMARANRDGGREAE